MARSLRGGSHGAANLTVNATPEPVTKGKTITVAGTLKRANWETYQYAGYTNQPVKLLDVR